MTDSCNGLAVGGDNLDRLTSLPINVIHQIQEQMPIEDAARTSVLSSTWRYVWSSKPNLKFKTQFCKKRTLADTIDTISTILFQHHGAIKTFLVDTSGIHPSQHSVIDKWLLFLSRNGLVDLTLQNNNANVRYKLPSYMYGVELDRLVLSNCIFRPPYSFRGFDKLTCLTLKRVAFKLEVTTSSLLMPNLERMHVIVCRGLRILNIYAPKLFSLLICACSDDTLVLSPFMDCRELQKVGLVSPLENSLNRQETELKLTNLLSRWPNIHTLYLGRYFLKFFSERLPTTLSRLRVLGLCSYFFDCEDQISQLLCILRSCPSLEELQFVHGPERKSNVEVDVNLLEGAYCKTQGLNNLQKLLINDFYGSRTELHFVRFILASAPLLRKAFLFVDNKSVHESQLLKISKELLQFPRVSPKLEIIYEMWSDEHSRLTRCF